MQVPFSYLDQQFSDCDAIFEDMKDLVKKGKFTLGQPLKVFEEKYHQIQPYAETIRF